MELHTMKYNEGARKSRKRKGRGPASGNGKTAGRGENGQKSRSGGNIRLGFEGGQNPIYRRLPKRGFSNARFKKTYAIVNLHELNCFPEGTNVTPELLIETKMVKQVKDGIKILGNGELKHPLKIKAHQFSKQAEEKIFKVNGEIEVA